MNRTEKRQSVSFLDAAKALEDGKDVVYEIERVSDYKIIHHKFSGRIKNFISDKDWILDARSIFEGKWYIEE
jgi:hypothetical protein